MASVRRNAKKQQNRTIVLSRFRSSLAPALCIVLGLSWTDQAHAQSADQTTNNVEASTDVDLTSNPQSDSSAQSGGNVFDFSSSGGGRNTPPAPNLPSFAGGPCTGPGGGVSASGPGFSIGGGRSFEDEACQRRNWVQTLIGASQHMPELEANELKRVAIAIMMQDQYVGEAFRSLGYDTNNPGQVQRPRQQAAAFAAPSQAAPAQRTTRQQREPIRASMSSTCVAVVPANASPRFKELVAARGCTLRSR